jgi:hypothetical protein
MNSVTGAVAVQVSGEDRATEKPSSLAGPGAGRLGHGGRTREKASWAEDGIWPKCSGN